MGYRIGSFNCEKGSNEKEDKNDYICKIIKDNGIQIIALQEFYIKNAPAKQDNVLYPLPPSLQENLPGWQMAFFRRNATSKNRANLADKNFFTGRTGQNDSGYAVLWDSKVFKYIDHSENKGAGMGRQWKNKKESWYNKEVDFEGKKEPIARPPQIVCLRPVANQKAELRILNTHIRFGDGEVKLEILHAFYPKIDSDELKSDGESRKIRKRKVELSAILDIYKEVNESVIDGIQNIHTLLMGDFNLNPLSLDFEISKMNNLKKMGNASERTNLSQYQRKRTTISDKNIKAMTTAAYYSNSYDHFIVNSKIAKVDRVEKIDTIGKFFKNEEQPNIAHREKLSDHVPIVMDFNIK